MRKPPYPCIPERIAAMQHDQLTQAKYSAMLQRDIFVDVASPPPLFTRSFAPRPTAFFYARLPDSGCAAGRMTARRGRIAC